MKPIRRNGRRHKAGNQFSYVNSMNYGHSSGLRYGSSMNYGYGNHSRLGRHTNRSKIIWFLILLIAAIIVGLLIYVLTGWFKAARVVTAFSESGTITYEREAMDMGVGNAIWHAFFMQTFHEQLLAAFEPVDTPVPVLAKGIYVTANHAGMSQYFDPLTELCAETEINTMVIDVKTDQGEVTFKNEIPLADEMGISVNYIPDIRSVIATLNENGIYPIARIVAFKDDGAYHARPDLYIKNADGSLWRDSSEHSSRWLNPYNRESWDYLLAIAKGAIEVGFQEIQFDYIRFDTSQTLSEADFGDTEGRTRIEIINEFTAYASQQIREWGAYVSADVYGTVISSQTDAEIVGQDYRAMAAYLDYICPMVYPSHYAADSFGIAYPDTQPYEVIGQSMHLSGEILKENETSVRTAIVRPWLQGFTASWLGDGRYISYTPEEIKEQIKAAGEAGVEEWLIWNPSASYEKESFGSA